MNPNPIFDPTFRASPEGPRRQALRRAADVRGMTLIEIMVVLAIIGLIMGGLVFAYMNWFKSGQEDVAKTQVQKIGAAVMNYYLHNQEYPNTLDELVSGRNAPLKKSQLRDPWKQEWVYTSSPSGNSEFTLCSKGPDKREGSEDDICLE